MKDLDLIFILAVVFAFTFGVCVATEHYIAASGSVASIALLAAAAWRVCRD